LKIIPGQKTYKHITPLKYIIIMQNINDPRNIAGIGSLMNMEDEEDSLNISKLEKELINGTEILNDKQVDPAAAFKMEMEKIQNNISKISTSDNNSPVEIIDINTIPMGEEDISSSTGYSNPMEFAPPVSTNWQPSNPVDPQLNSMTAEEAKQSHINNVMQNIDDGEMEEMEKEREDDDKADLLERIATLRSTLEDDGIDISKIEEVDHSSDIGHVRVVFKALRLKNDGNRYRSFAEEIILAGAYGMEFLFDGKKEWFGRRPDLVGWPDTVKVKLRRMRYETTTFVKEVMQEYNISPAFRIALELIPSMFLYTRNRKISQSDSLVSDDQFKDAIGRLNSQD